MLEIQNLKKSYPGFSLDLSMEVKPGVIAGIIGPNGAGKTTLFKSVLNLVNPDRGQVLLFGKPVRDAGPEVRQDLGVALSQAGFADVFTLKDVKAVLAAFYDRFDMEGFEQKAKEMKLPEDKPIGKFSDGMKAKLRVLAAMSHKARLLILDEPTSGLDVLARKEILDWLRLYMEENEGSSILISSHISSDLEGLCDEIYLLDNGHVALHEDTDVILDQYGLLKLNEQQMAQADRNVLLACKKTPYGYACLTNQREYCRELLPEAIMEKAGLDTLMEMLIGKGKEYEGTLD